MLSNEECAQVTLAEYYVGLSHEKIRLGIIIRVEELSVWELAIKIHDVVGNPSTTYLCTYLATYKKKSICKMGEKRVFNLAFLKTEQLFWRNESVYLFVAAFWNRLS